MSPSAVAFVALLSAGAVQQAVGNTAGAAKPPRPLVAAAWVRTRDVRRSLSDVLDDALGHEHKLAKDVNVERLSEALRPIYAALPKNGRGLLAHSTVRYALHRHFVHKHGMYVKGFEPAGESWNSSSPADILEDKVPGYVQHLFEERLHDGFDLKELALLAATLEHFIHLEAIERLKVAYQLSTHTSETMLNREQVESVLERYMFLHLIGGDFDGQRASFEKMFRSVWSIFPEWPETQSFLREVIDSTLENEEGGENGPHGDLISFALVSRVVEAAGQRYGRFQDGGCRALAKELVAKEENGNGRLKLSDFYQAGWQFKESRDYLRQLGSLDESTDVPRVIIPNYIASVTNCVASSSLYSVCCIDQCEELLGHLERRIAAPYASPEKIIELVSALPSATVQAPRTLSASVTSRLSEIAKGNSGRVPLHGRLFAQWMHHAYPRECPFPAKSGTTKPMTADQWMQETNSSIVVDDAYVEQLIKETSSLSEGKVEGDMEDSLPWLSEEELVFHHSGPSIWHEIGVVLRALAFVGALSSATLGLLKKASNGARQVCRADVKV